MSTVSPVNAEVGNKPPPILVLVATSCADAAADAVGQAHLHYAPNTYLLRVPAPVLFPDQFYFDCFDKGFAGIIIMSCGHECPYPGAFERITRRIDRVKLGLKERGIDPSRIRLTAICTVCTKAYLKEIADMNARVGAPASAPSPVPAEGDTA